MSRICNSTISLLLSAASLSFLACMTILLASSNNSAVSPSSSVSISFFSFSATKRRDRSISVAVRSWSMFQSTSALRKSVPSRRSRSYSFFDVSNRRFADFWCSISCSAACNSSSRFVWLLIALMSLELSVPSSSSLVRRRSRL